LIYFFIRNPESKVNKFFGNKIFSFLGKISYSLYLWHYFVDFLIENNFFYETNEKSFFFSLSLKIIFTLILGIFSYFLIEQPFQKSKLFQKNKPFKAFLFLVLGIIIIFMLNNHYLD
jgi:peptidoglycan/LPS O-acetylase OafA/YrhL